MKPIDTLRNRAGNDPRYDTPLDLLSQQQAIPEPNPENLIQVCAMLKEAVEVLLGQRGDFRENAVLFKDLETLGVITTEGTSGIVLGNRAAVTTVNEPGGSGSAGSGNQYVSVTIKGKSYKLLHDGAS